MTDGPVRRPRMLLLQHAVYPYRRQLFDKLASAIELTVVFCVSRKPFRRWDTSGMFVDPPFRARVLSHLRLGRLVVNHGLVGELRRGHFDVIVVGVIDLITLPQLALLLLWSFFFRIPVVACEEFFPTPWYLQSRPIVARVAVMARRLVYRRCAAYATWNLRTPDFLRSCGIEDARIFSGPHFYPEPSGTSPPKSRNPTPTFVCIAYLLPRKGLTTLIRAFKRIPGDVALAIAGSGDHETELRRESDGDPRVHFLGHLEDQGKRTLLANAYALVLPTLWDPWGLVVNEALYEGVPVVVTDAAGVAPSIGAAGLVVPAGDEDALHDALSKLLQDRGLRDAMADSARATVADWTLEAQAQPLLDAIRLALASRSGGELARL